MSDSQIDTYIPTTYMQVIETDVFRKHYFKAPRKNNVKLMQHEFVVT